MLFVTALPLLCLAPSVLAGVLDLFARDRCFPNSCYWAVKAASTASVDCYKPTVPPYALSCRDSSRFSSACSCLSILAAATSATSAQSSPISGSSTPVEAEVVKPVATTIINTVTTAITVAPTSSTKCVATTWTGTVTAWATTTVTLTPVPDIPISSASVIAQVAIQPSSCLGDTQATNIANAYLGMLTNTDRSTVNTTAADLIADDFFEMSGSENSLNGQPVSSTTHPSRDTFLAALSAGQAIPMMTTMDIFHDCNRIAWYWAVNKLGSGRDEIRGVSLLYTIPQTLEDAATAVLSVGTDGVDVGGGVLDFGNRKVNMIMQEFNSAAWATDQGRTLCAGACAA